MHELQTLATMGGSEYGLLLSSMPMVFQSVVDILSGVLVGVVRYSIAQQYLDAPDLLL